MSKFTFKKHDRAGEWGYLVLEDGVEAGWVGLHWARSTRWVAKDDEGDLLKRMQDGSLSFAHGSVAYFPTRFAAANALLLALEAEKGEAS